MRTLVLTAIAAVALLAAGCGGGSDASSTSPSPEGAIAPGGSSAATGSEVGPRGSPQGEPTQTPEANIEDYGSAAHGAEKARVAEEAFSFLRAMAGRDYAKVCAALTATNVAQLQSFLGVENRQGASCAAALAPLLAGATPEARRAADGKLRAVRIKGDTAFVIFRPRGGVPSYIVLRREGGAWKAISLAPGAPLEPTAGVH